MRNDFKTCLVIFSTLLLASCSSTKLIVPSAPTERYELPETYKQHRSQQQYFSTSDGSVAYTDHGEGDVLVLLHGVPTSSWMYRKIIPDLQNNFRVITIDFLGYGSSDKPDDNGTNYLPVSHAKRIQALLSSLNVNEFSLLMHDMGGLVAWEMLRQQPTSIRNLIVLNTIVRDQGFDQPDIKPGVMAKQMSKAYSNNLTSVAVLQVTFGKLGLVDEYKLSDEECFGYVQPMKEGSDEALHAFFVSLNDDLFEKLQSNQSIFEAYNGNTLVMWGGKDDILTTGQIPFLQEHLRIPDENIHIYSENNHFLVEEIPEEVTKEIAMFMGSGT